jgi:hypothetical protein
MVCQWPYNRVWRSSYRGHALFGLVRKCFLQAYVFCEGIDCKHRAAQLYRGGFSSPALLVVV